ncbi:MAG: hypothetical protein ABI233_08825 [Chthoniobacterales bacterium]
MRNLLAAALFFGLALSSAAAPRCTFRVHVAANANDGGVFAQPMRSLSGKSVYIERTPWLSENDVTAFYPYKSADGTSYGALLQLDDHGRTILDTLSVERRGSTLFIFVNGRPLTELLVDKRVSDGKIYLPSGLTQADIKSMAKAWKILGRKKK